MPRRLKPSLRPTVHFSMVGVLLGLILFVGAFPVSVTDTPSAPVLNASRFTLPSLAAAVPTAGTQALTVSPVPLTTYAPATAFDQLASSDTVNDLTEETRDAMVQAARAGSSPSASTDDNEVSERIPIFFEYEVKAGDTLVQIAERFGINVDHVVWNNSDVQNANDISPGQMLQIPSVEGIIHSVRVNETVTEIAARYDADWRDIVEFRANNLDNDPNNIQPGVLILVPGGRQVPLAPPERPGAAPGLVPSGGTWNWPLDGLLTSPYGPSHPLGIDIAAPVGSPVRAASSGQVTFAGGNPCCSYGYHIIIDHGDGYETLYAHLSDFAVGNGTFVNAGEVVGWIGMTGRTTGPHVHFELRRHGGYQNPMQYLP